MWDTLAKTVLMTSRMLKCVTLAEALLMTSGMLQCVH